MARQKGVVSFEGTLGGLNFYIRKGVPVVRTAGGGFNGATIKKDPSMVRVRENGSEFKGCMQVTKNFKIGMNPLLCLFKDGTMHHRLVQLFTWIKDCDVVSSRGERHVGQGVLTEAGLQFLHGYVITPGSDLAGVLNQRFRFDWAIEGFVMDTFSVGLVAFPKGATHMELIVGWLDFDFVSYADSFVKSAPLVISKSYTGTSLQVAPSVLPEGDGTKVGLVFLRFLQEVNGVFYPFKEADGVVLEVNCEL